MGNALRLHLAEEPVDISRPLTLNGRAAAYARIFPTCRNAVWVAGGGRWLYGHWAIGQDYSNLSKYYGAYPRSYLKRVHALFPDILQRDTLHAFSGSLPAGDYTRLDLNENLSPEIWGSVYDVALLTKRKFQLVLADPPYSPADAEKYGTPPLNKRLAIASLAAVTDAGGFLVWLDQVWPMYRKAEWDCIGQITLIRSTNHRVRMVSIFQRKGASA